MAKPIADRQPQGIPKIPGGEGLDLVPKTHWSPPKGLDYLNRKNRVDLAHCPEMLNLYLDRGVIKSRHGTDNVGGAAGVPVMGVVNFVTGSGIGFLIRFLTTKLQRYDGVNWIDIAGFVGTGDNTNFFAYTAFNNALIFSNAIDGMYEYDPMIGVCSKIIGAPNAKHLTTWGGRVIASAVNDSEFQTMWSAKNNSHDWTGEGSGDEELLSTPGGQVDQVMGTYPISDEIAIMVRTNSIWQVSQTGDPDAPFRFGRLHAKFGTRARWSVDVVPGGLIMVSNDGDVYLVNESQPTSIGTLVKDRIFQTIDISQAKGFYRPTLREYWLSLGDDYVYRYSFIDQGWTRHQYRFNVRWMEESIFHYGGITWDEMVGTWDTHPETWNSLLGDAFAPGFFFATEQASGNVVTEEPDNSTDDFADAAHPNPIGIEIGTGYLQPATPLDTVQVNEGQLEYEAAEVQALTWEYSTDNGATWSLYSLKDTVITDKVSILRAMKYLERDALMLRITSGELGKLTIISFTTFLMQGAKIAP